MPIGLDQSNEFCLHRLASADDRQLRDQISPLIGRLPGLSKTPQDWPLDTTNQRQIPQFQQTLHHFGID